MPASLSLKATASPLARWDVLVVGGGHAGCEAALAAARLGCRTLLVTMRPDRIGHMPCNPAIGGVGKGVLVKEIDAIGGKMARAADATAIQFRVLNRTKGPAVWGSRCQSDMVRYRNYMGEAIAAQTGLEVHQGEVKGLDIEGQRVVGVKLGDDSIIPTSTVVLTTGTFLEGRVHIGLDKRPAGRADEPPSSGLSEALRALGLRLGRLKTGTVPRLYRDSINWQALEKQVGDDPIRPFSFWGSPKFLPQVCCHITHTNPRTHQLIAQNLHRSALYSGSIKGIGPRYCPSIEDKVVKFPDRQQHQVFLEPTTLAGEEIYPNGLSTSLPQELQLAYLRTIGGLEEVEIMRPGYAVEYDFVQPTQLSASLAVKGISTLFLAGQLNGTTGYEEAAAQGLLAGINAAMCAQKREPFILPREESVIGVMVDDLITKGVDEPYRMFTSRAEYRLYLREDNADLRLSERSWQAGLLEEDHYQQLKQKQRSIASLTASLQNIRLTPSRYVNTALAKLAQSPLKVPSSAAELIKRPQLELDDLTHLNPIAQKVNLHNWPTIVREQVEINLKYAGYLKRQQQQVTALKKWQSLSLPPQTPYQRISGLSTEVVQKTQPTPT